MAGLCKLCFISILLLLLFPDFNTCKNAASPPSLQPVYAPVPTPTPSSPPTIVPPQSPPPTNINVPPPTTQGSSSSSRGLNGGQKAGIAIGVMSAAGALFLGGLVYKKRRSNYKKSQVWSCSQETSSWRLQGILIISFVFTFHLLRLFKPLK